MKSTDRKKQRGRKFDVIVGNPPFQKPGGDSRLGSRGDSAIWVNFVNSCVDKFLASNGYLSLIHPVSWRKPHDKYGLWDKLTKENCLIFLKILSPKEVKKYFNVGSRMDFYVVKKALPNTVTKTKIVDAENKKYDLDLSFVPWLPNYAIDEILSYIGSGCVVLYDTAYHTQKGGFTDKPIHQNTIPVVHTINREGLGIKYFSKFIRNSIHVGKSKVLLNQNELQYPYNDFNGKYGMSQLTFGIEISSKQEGDDIVKFLNSPKGIRLIAATKWNTYYTDYGMFEFFKKDFYK